MIIYHAFRYENIFMYYIIYMYYEFNLLFIKTYALYNTYICFPYFNLKSFCSQSFYLIYFKRFKLFRI